MTLATLAGSGLSAVADSTWNAVQWLNSRIPQGQFHPQWAPAPQIKSKERTFPVLGFPRETDSLCPRCVKEVRDEIVAGRRDWRMLVDENPGEIKATIIERDGGVYMQKTCEKHGSFEDMMAVDVNLRGTVSTSVPQALFRFPDRVRDR